MSTLYDFLVITKRKYDISFVIKGPQDEWRTQKWKFDLYWRLGILLRCTKNVCSFQAGGKF